MLGKGRPCREESLVPYSIASGGDRRVVLSGEERPMNMGGRKSWAVIPRRHHRWRAAPVLYLAAVVLLLSFSGCMGFSRLAVPLHSPSRLSKEPHLSDVCLSLVPVAKFRPDLSFFDKDDTYRICFDEEGRLINSEGEPSYEVCIVQEEDLPDVARFIIDAFGAEAISLSTDLNRLEKALIEPTVGLLNAYSGLMTYAEVLSGLQSRVKDRLPDPDLSAPKLEGLSGEEKLQQASRSSVVLAVGRRSRGSDWRIDVIASIELRLQPCDAKIPFSFPWLDRFERKLAWMVGHNLGNGGQKLQPYLSNLCVSQDFRKKKIGTALVRIVEDIATTCWGYRKLYLHVDLDNKAALKLYQNEGYKDAGRRWRPFWAGKAADIGYFVKRFGRQKKGSKSDKRSTPNTKQSSSVQEM